MFSIIRKHKRLKYALGARDDANNRFEKVPNRTSKTEKI